MLAAVEDETHLSYRARAITQHTNQRLKNNKVIKDSSNLRDVGKAQHD